MAERVGAPPRFWLRIAAVAAAVLGIYGVAAQSGDTIDTPPTALAVSQERATIAPSELAKLGPPKVVQGQAGTLLNIRKPMRYGQYLWNEEGVPSGPVWVRVDLKAQLISVFRAGHEVGTAVILYGADEKPTPRGQFEIIDKLKDHRSSLYDAAMPYTLRLTEDGIAIHGSDVAEGAATHGCIGVPAAFAALLFDRAKVGDRVTIV